MARFFRQAAWAAVARIVGFSAGLGIAGAPGSDEHKRLSVQALGKLEAGMVEQQVGLQGYMMQLRAITIDSGGQIARHNHANRPALVKVISGEWIEGRPEGETPFTAEDPTGILEDSGTTHWFYNRGDRICDGDRVDLNLSG